MSSIGDWLEHLGLGELTPRFEARGIDLAGACRLNDEDLHGLGLTVAQRRRLAAAIEDLEAIARTAELGLAEDGAPPPAHTAKPASSAQG
ncbi:MAG: hypothetical protein EA356_05455 [Geminicoccaceae bacterium]|nr:MAG: hypothetical protein EA356_05455 [Geminicoccaceae bacterium]